MCRYVFKKSILFQPARHSKLEKADILEMTVKHLEGLRSEGAGSPDRFKAGYRHCLSEVAKFPGLEAGLKRRLVRHLEGCVATPGARPFAAPTPPSDPEDAVTPSQHSTIFISGKLYNLTLTFPERSKFIGIAQGSCSYEIPEASNAT